LTSHFILIPCLTGVIILLVGLQAAWKDVLLARGSERMMVLGSTCFAAPLAVFGAEHIVSVRGIMQIVPPWMPGRMFWAYFVGLALVAAAISIVFGRFVRMSMILLTIMFLLFVAMIHIPKAMQNPADRIAWTVLTRDVGFAGGAAALSVKAGCSYVRVAVLRLVMSVSLIEFGVQHLLHPEFAPGVPLIISTPSWVPLPTVWGYMVGLLLIAAGLAILLNWRASRAAAWAGGIMAMLTLCLYVPMFFGATNEITLGMNAVADTLLFGGAAWLVAEVIPTDRSSAHDRSVA
jgi:uncharacterized membrane protein